MKKVFLAVMVCVLAGVMTSCSSSNSPRNVAEKALGCIVKEDYRGYFDCVYFPEDKKEEKEAYISMIEDKVQKSKEKGKGTVSDKKPVSYKFLSEEIDEEAGTAREVFEVTYANGNTKNEAVDLKKEADGQWYVKMDK